MKLARVLLLVAGLVMLGVLVAGNNPSEIFASILGLSWRLGVLVCFPMVLVMLFDTLGWRFAFVRDRVSFGTLVRARLAGEAFNVTTPTAALGGEAVKVWLLRGRVALEEAISSVIVAKTTITVAQGLFLGLGIVLAWTSALSTSALFRAMVWLASVEVVALGGFVVAQTLGIFGRGHRVLERLALRPAGSGETVRHVDRTLRSYYHGEPRRLLLSITFHLVAWLLGSIEAYLALRFLGIEVSLTTAAIIEAFGTAIRFATFIIPASVGVQEGGYAATFVALGLSPALGISFGLTRRVREIAWVAVGLIVFSLMRPADASRPADAAVGW